MKIINVGHSNHLFMAKIMVVGGGGGGGRERELSQTSVPLHHPT